MIKKEFKTYFSSTMYLLNTSIGYIILIGGAIALFFVEFDDSMLTFIMYCVSCFSFSTCCTSNCSLSLEGKNIWIYKSAPVDTRKIILSKALMNFILVFVTATISYALCAISLRVNLLTIFLLYILALVTGLVISFGGIFINLLLPKLDFENETQVVKQSASVAVSMFSFMFLFMIFPVIYFILGYNQIDIDFNLFVVLNICFLAILLFGILMLIRKYSDKLFKRIY